MVKDPVLYCCGSDHGYGVDLVPGLGTSAATGVAKKNSNSQKKKKKKKDFLTSQLSDYLPSFSPLYLYSKIPQPNFLYPLFPIPDFPFSHESIWFPLFHRSGSFMNNLREIIWPL